MKKKTVNNQNLIRVIRLLRHAWPMTRQEIAADLGLSMPTALGIIEDLISRGVIEEAGENASTGGRRAKLFKIREETAYGIGIQITRQHVRFALVNLAGEVKEYERFRHPFRDETLWYRTMGERLKAFLDGTGMDQKQILGAGISFPGIIDKDADMILHSHVFDLRNVSLDRFHRYIPFPLVVENDANCACFAEQDKDKESFLYISLNESVGGALMLGRSLLGGSNWTAGEAGHVILYPQGKVCYCGKKGCADAYLNTGVLIRDSGEGKEETLEDFFRKLDDQDPAAVSTWSAYLDDLAILCSNMRMILDMDIVLGGDVGACMDPWIEDLSMRMEPLDLFSRDVDYVSACRCKKHIFAVGAALTAIDYFDEHILGPAGD